VKFEPKEPHMPRKSIRNLIDSDKTNSELDKLRSVSQPDQEYLLGLGVFTAEQTKRFLKPREGISKPADAAIRYLKASPAIGVALKIDPEKLGVLLQERDRLEKLESTTHNLFRRAAENRMAADSDLYGALLLFGRFVRSTDDPAMARDLEELLNWISEGHATGPRDDGTGDDASAPSDEKPAGQPEKPNP
jgi:hypothetical protein